MLARKAIIVVAAALATPVAAKNAKLDNEVLGDWCWVSSISDGTAFFLPCAEGKRGISIRRDSYSDGEKDCKAIKIEIVDHVAGATRGKTPEGKPLLPADTPVYRVKYRCEGEVEGEGAVWNEVKTLVTVEGFLQVKEHKSARRRPDKRRRK
jgi:hypothetical protein